MSIERIIDIAFHLFMIFLAIWSGIAIFAHIRYGQSKILSLVVTVVYIMLVTSLYGQALSIISKI